MHHGKASDIPGASLRNTDLCNNEWYAQRNFKTYKRWVRKWSSFGKTEYSNRYWYRRKVTKKYIKEKTVQQSYWYMHELVVVVVVESGSWTGTSGVSGDITQVGGLKIVVNGVVPRGGALED